MFDILFSKSKRIRGKWQRRGIELLVLSKTPALLPLQFAAVITSQKKVAFLFRLAFENPLPPTRPYVSSIIVALHPTITPIGVAISITIKCEFKLLLAVVDAGSHWGTNTGDGGCGTAITRSIA